jgi:TldD protein
MIRHLRSRLVFLQVFILCGTLSVCVPASSVFVQEQEDVLLKALKDEMARSMEALQLKGMEKPYFIEYGVEDAEMFFIKAAFGAVVKSDHSRSRMLRVDLRVGSYELDSSEFVSRSSPYSMIGGHPRSLVQEDDYFALRHDVWLATDEAYKSALEQLAAKRSFVQTKVQPEEIPDFAREKVSETVASKKPVIFDQKRWEAMLRRLSAIFQKFPAIYDSSVGLTVRFSHKYYLNSEGSVSRQPAALFSFHARASTQASDGMRLAQYVPFYGTSLEQFPPEKEVAARIEKVAKELTALTSAPVLENYLGPVLLTGEAASELFAQVLAPQLSGHRPPLMDDERMAAMMPETRLAARLNRRVLPTFFTVVDDPTEQSYGKYPLIGCYTVDDQGVLARPVTMIERGFLRTLLMTRRPRKEITQSNGHARAIPYGSPNAQIGNLFIKAAGGKSFDELKQEMADLCQEQNLSYGLIIRKLDNPTITGRELSISALSMGLSRGQETISAPVLIYKVFVEDGREELVRGPTVTEMTVTMLKDIVAAGEDYFVNNRLSGGGGIMGTAFAYASMLGDSGVFGIPVSVVAPSVLFEEVEFKRSPGPQKKPAILEHPFFKK